MNVSLLDRTQRLFLRPIVFNQNVGPTLAVGLVAVGLTTIGLLAVGPEAVGLVVVGRVTVGLVAVGLTTIGLLAFDLVDGNATVLVEERQ